MECDAASEWKEEDCNCVPKSKYCSMQLQCNLPLVWSWAYCSCMHPDDLCPNTLRCPAWKYWDPINCYCAPKIDKGKMLKMKDFPLWVPEHCPKKPACTDN